VDHEVAIVHKDPFGRVVTLYTDWQFPRLFELPMDFIAHRVALARV
jgi:hypothetical protein